MAELIDDMVVTVAYAYSEWDQYQHVVHANNALTLCVRIKELSNQLAAVTKQRDIAVAALKEVTNHSVDIPYGLWLCATNALNQIEGEGRE